MQDGDVMEFLAARIEKSLSSFLGNFLQGFQAIHGKARAHHVHILSGAAQQLIAHKATYKVAVHAQPTRRRTYMLK